jgi:hypothetical protein
MNGDEWGALEDLIGPARCEQFMYMGVSKRVLHHDSWEQLRLYKHIDTRRYLNVAADGTCFQYIEAEYLPISTDTALEHVLG